MIRCPTLAFVALVALAGCAAEPGSGELTAEEERRLDDAAAMLNNSVPVPPESSTADADARKDTADPAAANAQ